MDLSDQEGALDGSLCQVLDSYVIQRFSTILECMVAILPLPISCSADMGHWYGRLN